MIQSEDSNLRFERVKDEGCFGGKAGTSET
jgi:hypothetical protein